MVLQVGVKALIQNTQGKYLFLLRSEPYSGETQPKWDVPGGRINIGEPLTEALKREIKEETSMALQGDPQILFAQDILRDKDKHVVRVTYLVQAVGRIRLDVSEHQSYKWLTLSQARKLYHDIYLTPVLDLLLSQKAAFSE